MKLFITYIIDTRKTSQNFATFFFVLRVFLDRESQI